MRVDALVLLSKDVARGWSVLPLGGWALEAGTRPFRQEISGTWVSTV